MRNRSPFFWCQERQRVLQWGIRHPAGKIRNTFWLEQPDLSLFLVAFGEKELFQLILLYIKTCSWCAPGVWEEKHAASKFSLSLTLFSLPSLFFNLSINASISTSFFACAFLLFYSQHKNSLQISQEGEAEWERSRRGLCFLMQSSLSWRALFFKCLHWRVMGLKTRLYAPSIWHAVIISPYFPPFPQCYWAALW